MKATLCRSPSINPVSEDGKAESGELVYTFITQDKKKFERLEYNICLVHFKTPHLHCSSIILGCTNSQNLYEMRSPLTDLLSVELIY